MSMMFSLPSADVRSFNLLSSHGSSARIQNPSHRRLKISTVNFGFGYLVCKGMQSAIIGRGVNLKPLASLGDLLPGASPPPPSNFPNWATWILGSIVTIILPLWKLKGGFLQIIENKVEKVVDKVEDAVEMVEDIAEVVEKVSSELADHLPENGVLKDAALWVENASKEVAEDAKETLDFIEKIDDFKEEVEKDWETIVENHVEEGEESEKEKEKEREASKENEDPETKERKEDAQAPSEKVTQTSTT